MDEQSTYTIVGWLRVGAALISMAVSAVALAFNLYNVNPQINWLYVALVSLILFSIIVWWHIYNLTEIVSSRSPQIKMLDPFVTDSGTFSEMSFIVSAAREEKTLKQPTWFAHARIINSPKYGTEKNHANNVVARLTYFDVKKNLLLGPVDARWSGSDAPRVPGDLQVLIRRQIRSDGLVENLDIVSRPKGGKAWYAFTNQNYFWSGMRDASFELPSDVVDVHIHLTGERVRKDFWITMYKSDRADGIQIRIRKSRLQRFLSRSP